MRPTATARSGFTLIELLLVIGIILLLAGLVVPQFIGQQQQAQIDTTRIAVHSFEQALDIYRMNAGAYPTTEQGLAALLAPPTSEPIPQKWVGPYLKEGSKIRVRIIAPEAKDGFPVVSLRTFFQKGKWDILKEV